MDSNYELSRIHNYIAGLMSPEEMHSFEKQALNDPFLQDALDGYALQNGVNTLPLSILQKRFQERLETEQYKKNRQLFTWQRLTVGSVAAVMFLVVCILIFMKHFTQPQDGITNVDLSYDLHQFLHVEPLIMGYANEGYPSDGWTHLNTYFVSHLSEFTISAPIVITFDIVNNRPISVEVALTGEGDTELKNKLIKLLKEGPKWEGNRASIKMVPNFD